MELLLIQTPQFLLLLLHIKAEHLSLRLALTVIIHQNAFTKQGKKSVASNGGVRSSHSELLHEETACTPPVCLSAL